MLIQSNTLRRRVSNFYILSNFFGWMRKINNIFAYACLHRHAKHILLLFSLFCFCSFFQVFFEFSLTFFSARHICIWYFLYINKKKPNLKHKFSLVKPRANSTKKKLLSLSLLLSLLESNSIQFAAQCDTYVHVHIQDRVTVCVKMRS